MHEDLRDAYEQRINKLGELRAALEGETRDTLRNVAHIDRIAFRVKGVESFLAKALDPSNDPPYDEPLLDIEDQVAGRIIVFFLSDVAVVRERLNDSYTPIEWSRRQPPRDAEFGYESEHLICNIPPIIKLDSSLRMPKTFELQLRTIFMHAYAEPQHDMAYKASVDLPPEIRREIAWIAASSWGADQAYHRVSTWNESNRRIPGRASD